MDVNEMRLRSIKDRIKEAQDSDLDVDWSTMESVIRDIIRLYKSHEGASVDNRAHESVYLIDSAIAAFTGRGPSV